MARFEQLMISDRRDQWRIPRYTGEAIINVGEITRVEDATVDTCPGGVFAGVVITMRTGTPHTRMLGQFADIDEANNEVDRFTAWLTGRRLLA